MTWIATEGYGLYPALKKFVSIEDDRSSYTWETLSEASLERALGQFWLVEEMPKGTESGRYEAT